MVLELPVLLFATQADQLRRGWKCAEDGSGKEGQLVSWK